MRHIYLFVIGILCCLRLYSQDCKCISVVKEEGRFYATNVKINNKVVHGKFLIDTGSMTLINSSVFAELKLECNGKQQVVSDGFINDTLKSVTASFIIDGIEFGDIDVSIIEDGIGNVCNVRGTIGSDLMKENVWLFTKDSIVLLAKSKDYKYIRDFRKEKLIIQNKHYPYFIVGLNTPRATTLFDTGDNALMVSSYDVLEYYTGYTMIKGKGIGSYGLFSVDTGVAAITTNHLSISDFKIENPVAYVENSFLWTVGTELLEYFDIILDFPKKRYYVKQIKGVYSDEKWNDFGFRYSVKNNQVFVRFVWCNSAVDKAGIEVGERILRINSLDLSEVNGPYCDACKMIEQELNTSTKITVLTQKDNTTKSTVLYKSNLFKK